MAYRLVRRRRIPPCARAVCATAAAITLALLWLACGGDDESGGQAASATHTPLSSEADRDQLDLPPPGALTASQQVLVLVETLHSNLPAQMRSFSATTLGATYPDEAVGPLVRAFGDPEAIVIVAAIDALPDTDDPDAREGLQSLTLHPDASVREAASRRLSELE